jgi:hypothetical protein
MPVSARPYRKKPVVVMAQRVPAADSASHEALAEWCGGRSVWSPLGVPAGVEIKTLEGTMLAQPGDWIIQGVQGEFYPCKPDIFDATYEPA